MILSDNETKVDMLNNRAIAKTIVELINESKEKPISIGIHGDWGAGKSSVLEMVEDEFQGKEKTECIKFNGWKHQGFEDAKIALMSAIVSELIKKRSLSSKCGEAVKKIWKNINWLNVAKGAGSLALTATTGVPPIGLLTSILDTLKGNFADAEKVSSTIENVGQYLKDSKVFEDTSTTKEFAEFQESFSALLEESKIDKLVILIDDLDRCLPEVTIQTLEAIRLFMFSNSTAFVIAADESMIEYAVKKHFPEAFDNNLSKEFSKRYLEKLIQVPFRLPALGEVESEMYISLLLIGSKLSESDELFTKLLDASIEKMKKPWKNQGLTISDLHEILSDRYGEVGNEIVVANQIYPILAKDTCGNPRKIKRFINMLLLRYKIAEARGFGDEIELPVLAKNMLVEYFMSEVYQQIAMETSESGKCKPLNELEKYLRGDFEESKEPTKDIESKDTKNTKPEKKIDVKDSLSDTCKEWLANESLCSWAKSEPSLGDVDLRPYYFASKEKQDYFFNQVKSEKLRFIIDGLMSSSVYYIASINDKIESLANEEAKYVFDVVSQKILGQGDGTKKPDGIDGVITLVKFHKELQSELISLIASFKMDRVGAWVCSGWDKCIVDDTEKRKLAEYYAQLSQTGNPFVKAALKTVKK
ncbi:MAG: Qat anti-phage system ATPase QatA [Thermotaleaceae bacterium]